jgi:FlaA1/EpsC-like NDP-sugar epimerase
MPPRLPSSTPLDASSPRSIWHRLDHALARLRPHREPLSLLLDSAVVALTWHITYVFRLGFERWVTARPSYDVWVMLGVMAAYIVAFVLCRVPQSMWRFSGFGEVKRLAMACLIASLLSYGAVMTLGLSKVPRAVLLLHPVFTLAALCLLRVAYRMVYEHSRARITGGSQEVRRALVLGAGEAAHRLLAGIHHQGWVVLGLLDDDTSKQGARIAGVPVLGPLKALRDASVVGAATHIIMAMPSLRGDKRRELFAWAAETGLPVLTVPSAEQLEGGLQVNRLRDIELEDLLGREPVRLDEGSLSSSLRGLTVLVTGAGGSIGSEICRQVLRYAPKRLVLVELSEFNLYSLEQELSAAFPGVPLTLLIGDVKDLSSMRRIMQSTRPKVVFHAAAYKHVPLMEAHGNALPCLRNNTLGTHHAALAAAECGAQRFVLVSTDKAVNPTNVMGATKRAAELVVAALADANHGTKFVTVRFGNVLGSSGSVIPKFKEQIERGGPVTVTHPDIIRYFMTIPEAARLVLQAAAIGDTGQVLVLDMGEPIKIVDLARQLIRLSGAARGDIAIEFSGLRPGEKLYEELLADADATLPTTVPQIRVAQLMHAKAHMATVMAAVRAMEPRDGTSPLLDDEAVRALLRRVVPEYTQLEANRVTGGASSGR